MLIYQLFYIIDYSPLYQKSQACDFGTQADLCSGPFHHPEVRTCNIILCNFINSTWHSLRKRTHSICVIPQRTQDWSCWCISLYFILVLKVLSSFHTCRAFSFTLVFKSPYRSAPTFFVFFVLQQRVAMDYRPRIPMHLEYFLDLNQVNYRED